MTDKLTSQQIFDRVAEHLLTQRHRAMLDTGKCAYRSKDGDRCAIGAIIPDELYDPNMEMMSVRKLLADSRWKEKLPFTEEQLSLLTTLQDCHDSKPPDIWGARLMDIARYYSLDTSVVLKFKGDENVG